MLDVLVKQSIYLAAILVWRIHSAKEKAALKLGVNQVFLPARGPLNPTRAARQTRWLVHHRP
jgi:hypothetical protein